MNDGTGRLQYQNSNQNKFKTDTTVKTFFYLSLKKHRTNKNSCRTQVNVNFAK